MSFVSWGCFSFFLVGKKKKKNCCFIRHSIASEINRSLQLVSKMEDEKLQESKKWLHYLSTGAKGINELEALTLVGLQVLNAHKGFFHCNFIVPDHLSVNLLNYIPLSIHIQPSSLLQLYGCWYMLHDDTGPRWKLACRSYRNYDRRCWSRRSILNSWSCQNRWHHPFILLEGQD